MASPWGRSIALWVRTAVGPGEPGSTDGELVARFAATQDPAAFELLVWRHSAMVLRTAKSVVKDHHTAEDVTQAVFLVLAKKAKSLKHQDALVGWLFTTTRRLAFKACPKRPMQSLPPDLASTPATTSEIAVTLEEEVARLPEKYRVPVLLCFYEGLTHDEAALRLGRPVGTIAGWMARAKTQLHDRLTRRGVQLPVTGFTGLLATSAVEAKLVETITANALGWLGGTLTLSPRILTLVNGAMLDMTLKKLQLVTASVAVVASLGVGGWAVTNAQGPGSGAPGGIPSAGPPRAGGRANPLAPVAPPAAEVPKPAGPKLTLSQSLKSQKNLRELMTAIHNYEAAYGHLPSDIYDAQHTTALLSWRVAILPYMGQDALYKQFKLDQPWDSEHNLKLLSKMPEVLRVGFEPKDSTHTYYQIIDAPGAAFFPIVIPAPVPAVGLGGGMVGGMPGGLGAAIGEGGLGAAIGEGGGAAGSGRPGLAPPAGSAGGTAPVAGPGGAAGPGPMVQKAWHTRRGYNIWNRVSILSITDGTSNTIGIMECGSAVAWTKPADMMLDLSKPLPTLAFPFAEAFHYALMDGSVSMQSPKIPEKSLREMMTAARGEITDVDKLRKAYPIQMEDTTTEEKAKTMKLRADNIAMVEQIRKELDLHADLLKAEVEKTNNYFGAQDLSRRLQDMIKELQERNKRMQNPQKPTTKK